MPYFLTIREGAAPHDSYPILATADPEIIELVTRGLTRKLLGSSISSVSVLKKQAKPAGTERQLVESGTEEKVPR
jgi:hypothetical protein